MFWVNFETLSVTLILEEIASNNPFLTVVVGDFNLKFQFDGISKAEPEGVEL